MDSKANNSAKKRNRIKVTFKKSIKIIRTKPCGESSPYWDHLEKQKNDEIDLEQIIANPDILDETKGLYYSQLNETEESQLDSIKLAMSQLSDREQQVLQLCGLEGLSFQDCAKRLGITVGSAQKFLNRAKAKILKVYQQSE